MQPWTRAGTQALRIVARAADPVLSGPSARLAARWWCTVPPPPIPVPRVTGGSDFAVTVRGCTVRGTSWGSGPVVYLVHGWAGTADQLTGLVEPLTAAGLRVVTFDAPSHGRSDPGPSGPGRGHGVEFGQALAAVAERFGAAHTVVAHSLGAISTLHTLTHGGLVADRLVLLAPLPNVRDSLEQFARHLGLGPRAGRRLIDLVTGNGITIDELDLRRLLPDAPVPLLVVHDRDDRRTPWASSARLVAQVSSATLITTQGLGHTRLLRDPGVMAAVASFVASDPAELRTCADGPEPDVRPTSSG